jgi:hypothetical protein
MKPQRSSLEKRNALEEGQKRGCCGSTERACVVPRASWREISLWKTQQMKNSLNFASTCLKVVDTRRGRMDRQLDFCKLSSWANLSYTFAENSNWYGQNFLFQPKRSKMGSNWTHWGPFGVQNGPFLQWIQVA